MFRMKKEPEQGTNNTISLKCFLCQGNWTGSNKEELREHLEEDHKVVFQIKKLIELSKPEEREPAAAGTYDVEQLLAGTQTRVDKNSSEKSQYFFVGNYNYFSGQPGEVELLTVTETSVVTNPGETKKNQYFIVGIICLIISLGQPEELEPIAPTDEEERIIKITETRVDSNSGKTKNKNYAIFYCERHY